MEHFLREANKATGEETMSYGLSDKFSIKIVKQRKYSFHSLIGN